MLRTHFFSVFLLIYFFPATAKTVILNKTGKIQTIAGAIQAASERDTVIIRKNIYNEFEIVIDKPLTIFGEGEPIVDGLEKGEIFSIQSDDVRISGLIIRNTGMSYIRDYAGIKVYRAKHCVIENNKLFNTYFGIFLSKSDSCIIRNNEVTGFAKNETGTGNAIHVLYGSHLLIEGNTLSGHRDGIYFEFVTHSTIIKNISQAQIRYGMHFMFSHHDEYFNNLFKKNGAGVAVMYSKEINMHDNFFSNNWSSISNGILLKDISDSRIERNTFEQNTVGIYAEGTDRVRIAFNDFKNNGWALKILGDCGDNQIIQNNFFSNTFEVATNSSVNHNFFEKNFWSNYNGYDLNRDGMGDVPHSPVTLFTYTVENISPSVILLRSLFIDLLNLAEKIAPVIAPETLTDAKPLMKPVKFARSDI